MSADQRLELAGREVGVDVRKFRPVRLVTLLEARRRSRR
jgi:hypothetical protein